MSQEGFIMDVNMALLFFRICRMYRINDKQDRVALLRELTRRKKVKYLRDVKPILAGKKVLQVGFKPPHNPGPEHRCNDCKPKEI